MTDDPYLAELVAQVTAALDLAGGGAGGRADVLDARQALDDLAREALRFKGDHLHACEMVAEMHAAATGRVGGPILGVVEDVIELAAAGDALAGYVTGTPQPDESIVEALVGRWYAARDRDAHGIPLVPTEADG
jgi:hypothetical protein